MIEGISEINSSKTEQTNISETKGEGGGDCSREKILNVVLLVMVFTLIGLFAYLFFSDRLIVGVENPFSNKSPIVEQEEPQSCLYDGVEYADGQGFPADDGCNSCSCTDGEVVCTLMACEVVNCIDSNEQCIGKENGSSCDMGIWCDEDGEICGGQSCVGLATGSCVDEVCQYLPD